MNAAVRAVVRMGIYVGCEVYLIREVSRVHVHINETRIGFCTGAGAVKSRGKTAGYCGSGKNDHSSSCRSVGSGTVCCGNPEGPGVKGILLPRDRESPPVP